QEPQPLRDLVPDIAPEIVEIIGRCLQKDREARYKDAGALSAALEAWVRGPVRRSGKFSNMVGSSPSLPMLAVSDEGSDPPESARTTGGSAAIDVKGPWSGLRKHPQRLKLLAAGVGGLVLTLGVGLILIFALSPSPSPSPSSPRVVTAASSSSSIVKASS